MDMPMKDGMEKMEKKPMFKCPACGEMLKVEQKPMDKMESKPKMNAGTMPMGDLKSKINPGMDTY